MARIAELDVAERLRPYMPLWAGQIAFACMCIGAATIVRLLIDRLAPGAGTFALISPMVLIATLFGRWFAGLVTAVVALLLSWYFVLGHGSFALPAPGDGPRIAVVAFANLLILLIAEMFRRAERRAALERDRQIAERDLFLSEFDHRVKNNFAVVTSLLDMQRRRTADRATQEALTDALHRVESIARAHRHLYRDGSASGVDIRAYISELCGALADVLTLRGAIVLAHESDSDTMPRDRAVSIGLVINELVTNAAKHAFPAHRDRGEIRVSFRATGNGWRLTVSDDGVGMTAESAVPRDGGLGRRLIEAFARQAGGTLSQETGPGGTRVTLDLEA